MNDALVAPEIQRSFSLSADWLEVLALARPHQSATDNDVIGPNDILEDRAAVNATDDGFPPEDPDIVDPASEQALDALFEEISNRKRVLDIAYPFDLQILGRRLTLKVAAPTNIEVVEKGRAIYIACLYMTAVRGGLINAKAAGIQADPAMGNAFQICATIAAAGYMSGDAYWFGHPRPDRTPFLDAIRKLSGLLQQGTPSATAPPGETLYAKDGGIDVVAWRDHHDGRPAKLIMYGQCASGMDWPGKTVKGRVDRMDSYYSLTPSKHWIPALLMPFPIYSEKENTHRLRSEDNMRGFYRQIEAEMGVIIDRLRVVRWCIEALRDVQPSMKDAVDRLSDLFDWSQRTSDAVRLTA